MADSLARERTGMAMPHTFVVIIFSGFIQIRRVELYLMRSSWLRVKSKFCAQIIAYKQPLLKL